MFFFKYQGSPRSPELKAHASTGSEEKKGALLCVCFFFKIIDFVQSLI